MCKKRENRPLFVISALVLGFITLELSEDKTMSKFVTLIIF